MLAKDSCVTNHGGELASHPSSVRTARPIARDVTWVDNEPHFTLPMAFLLPPVLPSALHVLSMDFLSA